MTITDAPTFVARLAAAAGDLATDATQRMETEFPWYRQLSADERAWVGLVAQAGISAFLDWAADPRHTPRLTADVFGSAPRELARIVSLEQTVALVRTTIAVVEFAIDALVDPSDRPAAREATLRYSREIAFSAAEVYARAAEARGAWDARLEALIIDSIVRDDLEPSLTSRISALGWSDAAPIGVIAGHAPIADVESALDVLRRAAQHHDLMMLSGIHGDFLISLIAGAVDSDYAARAARLLAPHFGPGPVVLGDSAHEFDDVGVVVRTTTLAVRCAMAWLEAPRPVTVWELLPERVLGGDEQARREMVREVYRPLANDSSLLRTAEVFLEECTTIEGAARSLFVHPNTVRYRLRRVAEVTGFLPTDPRGNLTLRLALMLGRTAAPQ